VLKALVKRNLKLYFRDRAAVFFSMLGVFVMILMYILFLGSLVVQEAEKYAGEAARFFMDSRLMSGIVAATSTTTCLGGFGIMVEDRGKGIFKDFESSPVPRAYLVLSYILSSLVIGRLMSLLTFFLGEAYIVLFGGRFLPFKALLKALVVILLSVSSSGALVFLLVTSVKSPNAFGTLSTLIGTLIGFLTGVYIPIGNLPSFIQTIIKWIPVSHAACALRQIMIEEAVPLSYIPEHTVLFMGIRFEAGNGFLPFWGHLAILLSSSVVFYILSVLIMSKRKNKS
jgi:multidrug/hemolysin transport system permease protein